MEKSTAQKPVIVAPLARGVSRTPWWLSPHGAGVGLTLPLLLIAYVLPADFHQQLGRPVKHMDLSMFLIGICGLLSFALGAIIGRSASSSRSPAPHHQPTVAPVYVHLQYASWLVLSITFAAYLIYLWPIFRRPALFLGVLWAQPGAMYVAVAAVERVPGLTSLTQMGMLYVVMLAIRYRYSPAPRPGKMELVLLALLLALAGVRAIAYAERLALLELLVPLIVVYARHTRATLISSLCVPIGSIIAVFAVFASLEFGRSWVSYYQKVSDGFGTFSFQRFVGYYVTALDNGAGIVKHMDRAIGPVFTFNWLWRFPVDFGQAGVVNAAALDARYQGFLYGFASPEFNNPSGLYMPFLDYGAVGGTVAWFVIGFILGMLYRAYRNGLLFGLLLYPLLFNAVVEIPRVFGFGSPRLFPPIGGAALLLVWLKAAGVTVGGVKLHGPGATPS